MALIGKLKCGECGDNELPPSMVKIVEIEVKPLNPEVFCRFTCQVCNLISLQIISRIDAEPLLAVGVEEVKPVAYPYSEMADPIRDCRLDLGDYAINFSIDLHRCDYLSTIAGSQGG